MRSQCLAFGRRIASTLAQLAVPLWRTTRALACGAAVAIAVACGGGGGSSPQPAAPTITAQAQPASVVAPQASTFNVVATGVPDPTYQWQVSTDGGTTFANISGANGSSHTTPATAPSDSGKLFRVTVSNSAGSIQSDSATLTVSPAAQAPVITSQPGDQTVIPSAVATFGVSATDTSALSYQWQVSLDGGATFVNVGGATAATYTTPAAALGDSGKRYRVSVSNGLVSVSSAVVTLTVEAPPPVPLAITATPSPVLPGQPVTFTVTEMNTTAAAVGNHNLFVTVPDYTTVESGAGATTCSGGTWPCQPGQTVSWVIATAADQVTVRQFTAVVSSVTAPPNGSVLTAAATTDGTYASSASTSVVASRSAGLQLGLDADSGVVTTGGALTFVLTFSNASSTPIAADLALPLPSGTAFNSADDGGSSSGGVVQWSLGTVPAGVSGQRRVTLKVNDPLTASALIVAAADLRDPVTTQTLAKARAAVAVSSNPVRLTVSATPNPVQAGQAVTFTITELNTSSGAVSNHNLFVTVPPHMTVPASTGAFACSGGAWPCQPGQKVSWVIATASQQITVRQFTALVSGAGVPPSGSLLAASVTTDGTYATSASTSVTVSGASGLQLGLDADQNIVAAGGSLSYTLTYSNPPMPHLQATSCCCFLAASASRR